jgi:hypothetical protein
MNPRVEGILEPKAKLTNCKRYKQHKKEELFFDK